MSKSHGPLRIGIGGPVGSGKTALMDLLCKSMRQRYDIAAITNDIYTKWDAEFLVRSGSLTPDRIAGVETGGCPHTAIREDASMNLAAVADMRAKFPDLDLVLIESGGDNLAATFSPELADLTIYVIDVAAGDKIPSKGGPGITRSDLLVINKIDLAPHVGASLEKMDTDAKANAGRAAVRDDQPEEERRARSHHRLHRDQGRPAPGGEGQGRVIKVGYRLDRSRPGRPEQGKPPSPSGRTSGKRLGDGALTIMPGPSPALADLSVLHWNQIGTARLSTSGPAKSALTVAVLFTSLPTCQLRADERSVIFAAVGLCAIAMCLCPGRPRDASDTSSPTRHFRVSEWFGWASLSASLR